MQKLQSESDWLVVTFILVVRHIQFYELGGVQLWFLSTNKVEILSICQLMLVFTSVQISRQWQFLTCYELSNWICMEDPL